MKKKKNFTNTIAFIMAILVLVIFIPINLIVSFYDRGFDMTPSKKAAAYRQTNIDIIYTIQKYVKGVYRDCYKKCTEI